MNIEEFRKEFLNDLRYEADQFETDTEDMFLDDTFEILEEGGVVSDPVRFYFGKNGRRNRMMQIHGYAYDEAESSLSLIISDFKDIDEPRTLTQTQIDILCKRLIAFLDESCNYDITEYCDDSDETIQVAAEMKRRIGRDKESGEILKIRLVILTNATLSTQVKSLKTESFMDRPTEISIWTLERFFELKQSSMNEPLDIDLTKYGIEGIPCIKADLGEVATYEAYLAIIPGKILADIYLDYGSRLLEGNIRAFLSVRGKVNRGIRSTIKNEPEFFFTFNNGIATTASSVNTSSSTRGTLITNISNLQIINGGQTTASLASAIIKGDNKELNGIFVPMKLTIVKPEEQFDSSIDNETAVVESIGESEKETFEERYQRMIERISRCANSQNAVSDADFFSNHPFHVLMEKKSQKNMAPPKPGETAPTVWFYERSRGKWEQEQMKMKESERKAFLRRFPKNQRITKEKFAKCFNSLLMFPHFVSRGAARNMKCFAERINFIWDNKRDQINDFFFKKGVVSVIIFDNADRIINNQSWYPKGGCKAELVPYTISKIISSVPAGRSIDINRIWNNQALYESFIETIEVVSEEAYYFLNDQAHGGLIRSIAQQENTWNKFKSFPVQIPASFIDDTVELETINESEKTERREQNIDNELSMEIQVYNLGANYWKTLLETGMGDNILSPKDVDLLSLAYRACATGYVRPPSPKQAKLIMAIKERLEKAGIIVKQ